MGHDVLNRKKDRNTYKMKLEFTVTRFLHKLALASIVVGSALCTEAQASGPVAQPPYTVSVFAAPPSGLTNPDSITTANGNIYVVYANATNPDGTGGFSTIVEYSAIGKCCVPSMWLEKRTG